ncbi:MAG TPA: hypothetical protein VLY04_02705 [Bryobacteraceae bacterium]|nr:hypothetical protein [Bryobacteraceae bacterium]
MKKFCTLFVAVVASAVAADSTYTDLLNSFTYRNLGPWRTGAWVAAFAVPETPAKAHQRVMFAGARTGGVWRTTNSGTTWEPVTDGVGIASVGAVAVAPSDANVVWVGTGDNSLTRSAYYGDGVYKSTDGGTTWKNMGLRDSQHVARIVIHPTNPNIVWIAALGHEYSPNQERGVFKTTDGGATWQKQLFVNPTTGAVDLVIDVRDPNVLYAAMYDAMRYPWKIQDGGPGSGIFKTTDGGAHWQKLENGLPKGTLGRIGIDICRKNPEVLYAVVDNFNLYTGPPRGRGGFGGGAGNEEKIGGEVYRTSDAGRTWAKVSAEADDVSRKAGYSFNQIRVDPNNPDRAFITGSSLIESTDGGKTWLGLSQGAGGGGRGRLPFQSTFGDFRSLWIDPEDSDHMVSTSDGGVTVSYDGGRTTDHFANLKLGEAYAIGVDMDQPYHIYEGLQDHENWKGPVNGWSGSVNIDDWVSTGIGDGMYNEPDPTGRWLYNTQEFGTLGRVDMQLRTRTIIDPTKSNSPNPFKNVRPLGGRGANAPADAILYRFNWTAPVRISPQDHNTIYYGSQFLLRSKDRGDHWDIISPDLTTNNPDKINTRDTSIQHCTIITIDESPAQAGVIWAGTDDGKVQVTRDAGAHWFDATAAVAAAGGPADAWVTRVYGSRFAPGTAYITKSRRRQDDFKPYVFRTTDFGATWTKLTNGLPDIAEGTAIVEDTLDQDLLFLGTSSGVYVSFDRGANWVSFRSNMPPAPVSDLLVHPREGDLVVGTYGRGVWVVNIVPLRGMGGNFVSSDATLLPIRSFAQRNEGAWGNYRLLGDRYPSTPNEPNGMAIVYYLKTAPPPNPAAANPAPQGGRGGGGAGRGGFGGARCVSGEGLETSITIADGAGKVVCILAPTSRAGINRVIWSLNNAEGGPAEPGEYTVTLRAFGKTYTQKGRLVSRAPEDASRGRGGEAGNGR